MQLTTSKWTKIVFLLLCLLSNFLVATSLNAQTTVSFTSSATWLCPAGVTSIQVEAWGAGGGGGGGGTGNKDGGGGGGGGAYIANNAVSVTPGVTYTITIGNGGAGGVTNTNGSPGNTTSATFDAITIAPNPGAGGFGFSNGAAGGAGGAAGTWNGGNGGKGVNNTRSGGGGGGAGSSADGTGASNANTTAGAGGAGNLTGDGGTGSTVISAVGAAGGIIGGGGAGGTKNSTGGAGARGEIEITYTLPCVAPASQASSFVLGAVTATAVPATFSGTANGYLVIQSLTNTIPGQPTNGTLYNAGNIGTLGSGLTFVQSGPSTSIPGTGLTGNTRYYYFIFAYNNNSCAGGPVYATASPLTGNGITCPDIPNSVSVSSITSSGFTVAWAYPSGGSFSAITYTLQITTNATYTANIPGSPFTIANPTISKVVTGLASNTIYYYRILASNGCTSAYVTGNVTTLLTPCVAPASQASGFVLGTITSTAVPATFSGTANGFLVIQSQTNTPPTSPSNGTIYSAANVGTLGSGLTFIQSGAATSIPGTGLNGNTKYYYFIYAYNNTSCSGGPIYNASAPLTGTGTTCPAVPNTVAIASTTPNGFTVNWAFPTGGSSSPITYTLQITTNATYTANIPGSPFTIADPTSTKVVTGLASNTIYYYRILASNGCSSAYVTGNTTTLFPACVAPAGQANNFVLGTVTTTSVPATFSGTANGYLVIQSLSNTIPTHPVSGTLYSAANIGTLGSGLTFIQSSAATSIPGTGLSGNTKYYYFIYAYNNTSCSGGPAYNAAGPLTGNGTTCTAIPNLVTVSSNSSSGFTLNWVYPTGGNANAVTYTLQITTNAAYTTNIPGSPFTIADPTTTKVVTGLASNTIYYYRILANNGCSSAYVTGSVTTLPPNCVTPATQASTFVLGTTSTTSVPATFSGTANGFLVISSLTNTAPAQPVNGTTYSAANIGTLGSGLTFVQSSASTSIAGTGLTANTKYYYFIYAFNNTSCSGGPLYNTLGPLTGNGTTCPDVPNSVTTSGNTTTGFTLNWTAPSGGNSATITYTIQVTTDAGYTTNISGSPFSVASPSTSLNVTGLTANTTYYYRILANNGCSSAYVNGNTYTGYCISTGASNTDYINNFSTTGGIANITNNGSGYSATGYGNFTAKIVSQQPYGTVNFSSAYTGGTFGFNIWVDWNNDLDFDDISEKVYGSGGYNAANTGSFSVPAFASVGNHRMRIRADYWASNPSSCGAITNGETEDYTFTVVALPCSGNPSNLTASAVNYNTATISWTAAAPASASGYQYYYSTSGTLPVPATTPSGSTAAGVITANLAGLASGTYFNVWVRSNCGANQGVWIGPLNFTTITAPPVTTGASFCQGGSGTISATASCTNLVNLGTTINGGWDANSDPRAIRPIIFMANAPTCQFDGAGLTSNYTAVDFQVSVTGNYVFTMAPTTAYDSMGYIVIKPFNPGVCGSGTWVVGDDDSGPTTFEPEMNATLTAGITYTLISTLYSGSNITLTNTFQWNVTAPPGGYISGVTAGAIQWYTTASGGTPIGTGTPFNPVGVAGSGLTDTNTPGTTTFYAACPSNPSVRTPVNYTINGPTSTISGNGSVCSGSTNISIALTGTSPWTFTYTDGTTPVTVTGNTTNPYVFTVSPTVPTNYTVTALSDATCTALAINRTGTGTVSGSKTWSGTTDSDWSNPLNWAPNGVPAATDCVVIPSATNSPIISGSGYNAYCNNLTILSGGILLLNTTNNLTVKDFVNVDPSGQFYIKDSASLIQINNVNNTGNIDMERITQPMYRFDYTYWGTPVTLASNFTLGNLSPNTLSDKFFSWTPTVGGSFGNWFYESAATVMNPIKGYIVRAPQTFSPTPGTKIPYTANFVGTPNNGTIACPIYHGTLGLGNNNDKYNLLGNPYPSAVDAQAFLTDPSNVPVIDGTIYFWTHNSAPSSSYVDPFYGDFVINYSSSDYASWNSLGSVGSRGSAALSGGSTPNGYIAAGQGFFTKSTGTAPSGNTVAFKNTMRVASNNSQFFRSNSTATPVATASTTNYEKHRIWLNLINNGGSFNQILVGYTENATTDWDRDFDGVSISENSPIAFYSLIPDKKLVIQGRPLPFVDADLVPLGFKTNVQDTFSIRIDHFDGLFENQNIYIEDRLLNSIHDLKQSPYLFTSEVGIFTDRFVLRYTNETLSIKNNVITTGVISFIKNEKLVIQAANKIKQVDVYDITGKLIETLDISKPTPTIETNFYYAEGVYMLKIKFENNSTATKKLIHQR